MMVMLHHVWRCIGRHLQFCRLHRRICSRAEHILTRAQDKSLKYIVHPLTCTSSPCFSWLVPKMQGITIKIHWGFPCSPDVQALQELQYGQHISPKPQTISPLKPRIFVGTSSWNMQMVATLRSRSRMRGV